MLRNGTARHPSGWGSVTAMARAPHPVDFSPLPSAGLRLQCVHVLVRIGRFLGTSLTVR